MTRSQREFYEKNGFLVVPNLIPHELIDECRQRFLDIVNGVVDAGQILKMKDLSLKDKTGLPNERIYNKIQAELDFKCKTTGSDLHRAFGMSLFFEGGV